MREFNIKVTYDEETGEMVRMTGLKKWIDRNRGNSLLVADILMDLHHQVGYEFDDSVEKFWGEIKRAC